MSKSQKAFTFVCLAIAMWGVAAFGNFSDAGWRVNITGVGFIFLGQAIAVKTGFDPGNVMVFLFCACMAALFLTKSVDSYLKEGFHEQVWGNLFLAVTMPCAGIAAIAFVKWSDKRTLRRAMTKYLDE